MWSQAYYHVIMCRSIKVLRRPEEQEPATAQEVRAAALQFVRKISGFQKPSKANQQAFERAVEEITATSERLLAAVATPTTGVKASSAALGDPQQTLTQTS